MEKINIFYKLGKDAKVPEKKHWDDAGFDLFAASNPKIIGEQTSTGLWRRIDYIEYETNLGIEPMNKLIPLQFELRPRSSISKYNLALRNTPSTVDNGYRGNILVRFAYIIQPEDIVVMQSQMGVGGVSVLINMDRIYQYGDKICQLVPDYVRDVKWIEVEELTPSERGEGGFGSTGK